MPVAEKTKSCALSLYPEDIELWDSHARALGLTKVATFRFALRALGSINGRVVKDTVARGLKEEAERVVEVGYDLW